LDVFLMGVDLLSSFFLTVLYEMRGVLLGGYEAYGQGKNVHVRVWDCGYELGSGLLDGRTETDRGGKSRITANSQSYRGQYKHEGIRVCDRASERMSDCAGLSFSFSLISPATCEEASKEYLFLNKNSARTEIQREHCGDLVNE
jgi:hypothetical protein